MSRIKYNSKSFLIIFIQNCQIALVIFQNVHKISFAKWYNKLHLQTEVWEYNEKKTNVEDFVCADGSFYDVALRFGMYGEWNT